MCDCHSILECCVVFSVVKLSVRSFNLFHAVSRFVMPRLKMAEKTMKALIVETFLKFLRHERKRRLCRPLMCDTKRLPHASKC